MRRRVRIGIVGAGSIAKAHVIGLRSVASYFGADRLAAEIVAVADADGEAARRAADAFDLPVWSDRWQDLVEDDGIEAVTIATPNDTHAEIACGALAAGKHVLCEKPLAHSIDDARRMVEAAEDADLIDSVHLNYRNIPAIHFARTLIERGDIGEVVAFRAAFLQEWAADPRVARSWKFERERAGGGPLLAVGCHLVDLAHLLVGAIVEVAAATRTVITQRPLPSSRNTYERAAGTATAPVDTDDLAAVTLRFANGAIGTIETSRVTRGRKNHAFVEVDGTSGTIVFDYERMNEIHVSTAATEDLGLARVVIGPEQDGGLVWSLGGLGVGFAETVVLHMRDFLASIAEGETKVADFSDGLRAQEVIHAATLAAASKRWEPVPMAPVPRPAG